ncbi:MAG: hypothetical protein BZ138_03870 [Methanosphaera sp. rholeuAM270]|nr:MAG: hypothetical protein BZ138_03870 [Methanosphaera sp. rholeuAM270]
MIKKFLITGEIYERKKRYVIFSSGEEYVFNIKKSKSSDNPSEEDKKVLLNLREKELVNKLLKERDNFWYSVNFKDENGEEVHISNIKCFTHPSLISYELEQYRSALYN